MDLYNEFFRIMREFNSRGLKYAIVGGIAMAFHKSPRFTRDIDILVLPEDIKEIADLYNFYKNIKKIGKKKSKVDTAIRLKNFF